MFNYIVEQIMAGWALIFLAVGLAYSSPLALIFAGISGFLCALMLGVKLFVEFTKDRAKDTCSFNPNRRYETRINRP